MTRAAVQSAIKAAFKYWSDVTPLTFREVTYTRADIRILFHRNDNLCDIPFDGRGEESGYKQFNLKIVLSIV